MFGTICALGASSIYGSGDEDGLGFIHRLKLWYRHQPGAGPVHNLGIPGSTVETQAERAAREFAPRRPGLVILSTGINSVPKRDETEDTPPRCSIATYAASVATMVAAAREAGARVLLLSPFSVCPQRTGRDPAAVIAYRQAGDQAAAAGGAVVQGIDDLIGTDPARWAADGMHLCAAGHARLAEAVQGVVLVMAVANR